MTQALIYPQLRIAVAGDVGVGKTAMVTRLRGHEIQMVRGRMMLSPTIGVDFASWVQLLACGCNAKIAAFDLAGSDKFHTVTAAWLRSKEGLVLMFDLTSAPSFHALNSYWLPLTDANADPAPRRPHVLVLGNKLDLVRNKPALRAVGRDQVDGVLGELRRMGFGEVAYVECSVYDWNLELDRTPIDRFLNTLFMERNLHLVDVQAYTREEQAKQKKREAAAGAGGMHNPLNVLGSETSESPTSSSCC